MNNSETKNTIPNSGQSTDLQYKPAGLLNTADTDKQLRSRVRLFGNLLGNVLLANAGAKVYDAVEKLRVGFIALHKKEDHKKRERLMALISSLDENTLTQVVRAFSTYFSLVNIAEEASQLQLRRRQMRNDGELWVGSFDSALRGFIDLGMSAERLQTLLDRLAYIPVITAHPTEAKRRSVLYALRRIFVTNEKLSDTRLGKKQRQAVMMSWRHKSTYSGVQTKCEKIARRFVMKLKTVSTISKRVYSTQYPWFIVIWKPVFATTTPPPRYLFPAFLNLARG
jgi:phosphoenolpyruvate carboxylase